MKYQDPEKKDSQKKREYAVPKILATYSKKDLEEAIKPEAQLKGGGCGCGGS